MSLPLISVVIPAFNAETTVRSSIESALTQSHRHLEIIVCDDASVDTTPTIVAGIPDPRLRLIRNESNQGEGYTRDRAISAARGDWVAVLDADDMWHPRRIESMLVAAGKDADVMVFDDILVCHHTQTAELKPWRPLRGKHAFRAASQAVDVSAADWIGSRRLLIKPLIPRALLRDSRVRHSNRRFGADSEFFLRLLAAGARLRYLPCPLYLYRITPGSMTALDTKGTILCEMLAELSPLFAGDALMQSSIARKIAYRELITKIRSGDVGGATGVLFHRPKFAWEILSRSITEIPYHLHRIYHGGTGRT